MVKPGPSWARGSPTLPRLFELEQWMRGNRTPVLGSISAKTAWVVSGDVAGFPLKPT